MERAAKVKASEYASRNCKVDSHNLEPRHWGIRIPGDTVTRRTTTQDADGTPSSYEKLPCVAHGRTFQLESKNDETDVEVTWGSYGLIKAESGRLMNAASCRGSTKN